MDGLPGSSRADGQQPSRREFLVSMAAVGLTTAVSDGSSRLQGAASNANPQLIDVLRYPPQGDLVQPAFAAVGGRATMSRG